MRKTQVAVLALACTALVALLLVSVDAGAYPQYTQNNDNNFDTYCAACHGNFRAGPYTSLGDGVSWGDDMHDVHREGMLGGDCNTCHYRAGRWPVPLDTSNGGDGLDPVACMGCHGRAADDSTTNGGNCTIADCGPGTGLRQHHYNAGETICLDCHDNADPANYTPVGEDVPPPYYANPGTGHNIPSDPCNDDFVGGAQGLDNDGDGDYDAADTDCGPPPGCQADAECDNGLFCDGGETCDLGTGQCLPGAPVDCDDGVGCTADSCNEGTDSCDNAPDDAVCDDGAFCNGAETCDPALDCQAGAPVDCDDGVGCTADSCNEGTDSCDNTPDDAVCDDGAFCNGAETCDPALDCQAGAPPCDPATETCDEAGGVCEPIGCQSDAECDNGLFCDGGETCDLGTGQCLPGAPVDCDDGVGCTVDSCNEGTDSCDNAPDDAVCDDGAFCNGAETCDPALDCQAGAPVDCDDGVGCTADSCNEGTDSCDNAPDDAVCDDGAFCNGAETCDPALDCQAGAPVDCDDGVGCTADSCNEGTDSCDNTPDDAVCDDGAFCNGAETCDPTLDCQAGAPVDCDDDVGCTVDSCDEGADSCDNTPDDAVCDDGAFCNGAETCDPALDCQAGAPPCDPATETCDEAGGVCEPIGCQSDAECDNGLFCDGGETCDLGTGQCLPGAPVDCDDGVGCTADSCNEGTDSCDNAPDDAVCDDGAFCNGAETCDPALDCQAGAPVDCDDGVDCTADSCNEGTDSCDNTPDDAVCDDGAFCNGAETCDPALDCQAGAPPCDPATETCDEAGGVCEPIGCQSDAECDNGLFCDGGEICDLGTGQCLPGAPVDCDDGVGCTADSCNEGTDSCDNTPDDAVCDDGAFCNGAETCDPALDCQAGAPVDCDDGVGCTVDSCNEGTDSCDNAPDDAVCDDGAFCNGAETCDPALDCQAGAPPCDPATETCDEAGGVCEPIGCQSDAECDNGLFCDGGEICDLGTGQCLPGAPVDCDDGVGCTADSCNEGTDSCDNTPDDAVCDDGAFCNGAETCDPALDCQAGAPPCDPATETCDEAGGVCEPIGCQSDAECDNGLFCDGGEICDLGTGQCLPGAPVDCDDGVGCTADSCNEGTDSCDNAPDDAVCDDGAFCNGAETCDPALDCQAGAPPSCDDGLACSVDFCDPALDQCVNDESACMQDEKVLLCHKGKKTLKIDADDVDDHLGHGDTLGPCPGDDDSDHDSDKDSDKDR